MASGETWKPVRGFEGLYEVSDQGNVRNAKDKALRSPYISDRGYVLVTLFKDNRPYKGRMHRLVADAFVKNPDPKRLDEVGHKDDNPKNNKPSNLYWTTRDENLSREANRAALSKAMAARSGK